MPAATTVPRQSRLVAGLSVRVPAAAGRAEEHGGAHLLCTTGQPIMSCHMMTPKEYTSANLSTRPPLSTSGAECAHSSALPPRHAVWCGQVRNPVMHACASPLASALAMLQCEFTSLCTRGDRDVPDLCCEVADSRVGGL